MYQISSRHIARVSITVAGSRTKGLALTMVPIWARVLSWLAGIIAMRSVGTLENNHDPSCNYLN
jgi:hypothetical protein